MKNHSLRPVFSILTLVFASISTLCLELRAQAPVPDSPAIEAQAHALLSKLTLEQKIELLGGVDNMYTRPMPAIGLPRFKMSDASVGVRTWGPTTAYAGGVGARRHLGHRPRRQARRSPRPRCPRPQCQLPARSRRQHCPLARFRPQLRVPFGRPVPQLRDGGAVD